MSWICNNCETSNHDEDVECEVCSSKSPIIEEFNYSEVDVSKPTLLKWREIECDNVILCFKDKEYDVTGKEKFELFIEEKTSVTFKASNSITIREFSFIVDVSIPRIIKIEIDKETAFKNEKIHLKWNIENCSSVEIDGVDVGSADEFDFEATKERVVLLAKNAMGIVSKEFFLHLLNKPQIELTLNNNKLKRTSSEAVCVEWKITDYDSAKLLCGSEEYEITKESGSISIKPLETSEIVLRVYGLDKKTVFTESALVGVFDECEIDFTSDKEFSFINIPIFLSWDVKHAKWAKLNGENVEFSATKTVTIEKDTTYVLQVEDEFGVVEKSVTIRMLPIPIIESVFVTTPKIENTINIHQYVPKLGVNIKIEQLNTELPQYNVLSDSLNKLPEFNFVNTDAIEFNEIMEDKRDSFKIERSSFDTFLFKAFDFFNGKINKLWKKQR